jgi:hypothetical protein
MLDTIERVPNLGAEMPDDPLGGRTSPTVAQVMVPMLDWPADLFAKFPAEVDDEIE